MWAYVYFSKTQKYGTINVDEILNFDRFTEVFSDKKVYSVKLTDGSQAKCQVLLMADTRKKLDTLVNEKRRGVPKLSRSMFEDDTPPTTNTKSSIKKTAVARTKVITKKLRSQRSQSQQNATRETSDSIVAAYLNSRESSINLNEDNSDEADDIDLQPPRKKVKHGSRMTQSQSEKQNSQGRKNKSITNRRNPDSGDKRSERSKYTESSDETISGRDNSIPFEEEIGHAAKKNKNTADRTNPNSGSKQFKQSKSSKSSEEAVDELGDPTQFEKEIGHAEQRKPTTDRRNLNSGNKQSEHSKYSKSSDETISGRDNSIPFEEEIGHAAKKNKNTADRTDPNSANKQLKQSRSSKSTEKQVDELVDSIQFEKEIGHAEQRKTTTDRRNLNSGNKRSDNERSKYSESSDETISGLDNSDPFEEEIGHAEEKKNTTDRTNPNSANKQLEQSRSSKSSEKPVDELGDPNQFEKEIGHAEPRKTTTDRRNLNSGNKLSDNERSKYSESSDETEDRLDNLLSRNTVPGAKIPEIFVHHSPASGAPSSPDIFDSEKLDDARATRNQSPIRYGTPQSQLQEAEQEQTINNEPKSVRAINEQLPKCSCWFVPDSDDDATDDDSDKSKEELLHKVRDLQRKIRGVNAQNSRMKQIALRLRDSYEELKESEGYPLTEATGRKIIRIIEEARIADLGHSFRDIGDNSQMLEKTRVGPAEVKNVTLSECKRARNPAKFVKTLAFGVWGYEQLAQRTVREQANTGDRKPLTPEKTEFVANRMKEWLKHKKCGDVFVAEEMRNVNNYLGRAISSAIRRQTGASGAKKSNSKKTTNVNSCAEGGGNGVALVILSHCLIFYSSIFIKCFFAYL